ETGDQLVNEIARSLLDQAPADTRAQDSDPLEQFRTQFAEQFSLSHSWISGAGDMLEHNIQLVIERMGLKARAYIFLDGLDEAHRPGEIVVVVESLAERL